MLPSIERIRAALDYDPETGIFRWKYDPRRSVQWNGRYVGKEAGCKLDSGYLLISIDRHPIRAHRLAMAHVSGEWPSADTDHRDRKRDNNRISNLRPATRSQNLANSFRPDKNTSGFKGVSWRNSKRPWRAYIGHMGKSKYLGSFLTPEEAHAAYQSAADLTFGEFSRLST